MADTQLDYFKDVDVVLDYADQNISQKIFAAEGDIQGRTLTVQVTNKGRVSEIIGAVLRAVWKNEATGISDITAFDEIDSSNGLFELTYPTHMMTRGNVKMQIQIVYQGATTMSRPFNITVTGIDGNFKTIIESQQFYALTQALNQAKKANPVDALDSYNLMVAKYPSGANGTVLAKQSDGYHSYLWQNGIWKDLGLYQAVSDINQVLDSINNMNSYLPSNNIRNDMEQYNNLITPLESKLSVAEFLGKKFIRSEYLRADGFAGYQGMDIKTQRTVTKTNKKKIVADVAVATNTKIALVVLFESTDGTSYQTTLLEKSVRQDSGIVRFETIYTIPEKVKLDTMQIRIIQKDNTKAVFFVNNFSVSDYLQKTDISVIDNTQNAIFDTVNFQAENLFIGNQNWTRYFRKSTSSSKLLRIHHYVDKVKSNLYTNDSSNFLFGYKINWLVYVFKSAELDWFSTQTINLKAFYMDSNRNVIYERLIKSYKVDRKNRVFKIDEIFTPSRSDFANDNVSLLNFSLEFSGIEADDYIATSDLNISLIDKNEELKKIPFLNKTSLSNTENISNTTIDNKSFRKVSSLLDPSSYADFGEIYIFKTDQFRRSYYANISFEVYNPLSTEEKYALDFYYVSPSGVIKYPIKTIMFNCTANALKKVAYQFSMHNLDAGNLLCVKIRKIYSGTSQADFYYTTPNFQFESGSVKDDLFGDTTRKFLPSGELPFINREAFKGIDWNVINQSVDTADSGAMGYGLGIEYSIDDLRDLVATKINIKGNILSKKNSKARIFLQFQKRDNLSVDWKYVELDRINLFANEIYEFNTEITSDMITTQLDANELYTVKIVVRGLPDETGAVSLYTNGFSAKIIENEKIAESNENGNLISFNIVGDLTSITKDDKKDVIVEFNHSGKIIKEFATVKLQGDSSLAYPKKSYRIDFFKDEKRKDKKSVLIIANERPLKSINLKANWIDWTSTNNSIASTIHQRIHILNSDTFVEKLRYSYNQEQCMFYPCTVSLNGNYNGLYTCSTKKGNAIIVEKDNENEIALQGIDYNDATTFKQDFATFDETVDFEVVDGELNDNLKNSFNELMKLINSSSDSEFKEKIATKINLQSVANVLVGNMIVSNQDIFGKNTTYQTFDGQKWYAISYDHDLCWGLNFDASVWYEPNIKNIQTIMKRNKLIERTIKLKLLQPFMKKAFEKFSSRYNACDILELVKNEMSKIDAYNYQRNFEKWPNQPALSYFNQEMLFDYIVRRYNIVSYWFTDEYLNNL